MRTVLIIAACGGLAACQSAGPDRASFTSVIAPVTTSRDMGVEVSRGFGPPDADPDSCYGREIDPAVIETVTEQTVVQPAEVAPDGTVLRPAILETATEQRMVEDRREIWFETPCEMEGNAAHVATLQRALAARGLHQGPVTGEMDAATLAAIRAYQAPQGLDSAILSLAAARQLGLSVWDPELAGGGGAAVE